MNASERKDTTTMSMRTTTRRTAQGAVAVGVIGLFLAATAMPAAASSAQPVEEVIPALAVPQTPADSAPDIVNLDALGVEASELRSLGSDDVADYWVARSGNEDVCLIAYVRGGNEVSSSACVSIADFYQTGLGIVTGESRDNPERATEAYLIPSDVDAALVPNSAQARQVTASTGTQFVAARPGSVDFTRSEIAREDGTTFVFTPIP